ncbi:MAG: rod shape-determining protein MreC [Pseudomonadota bacterium]|nr:rod shape-determining protein MreC [Pseudomonadota bacterium]
MKHRAGTVIRLAVPLRALTQRFAFLFLILSAFGLMLLGKAENVMMERLRAGVLDVVAPILDIASHPVATVTHAIEDVRQLIDLRGENQRLRAQNTRLLKWQDAARNLAAENVAFKKLLQFAPPPRAQFATARVIAASGGVFVRSVLLNAGKRHGLAKGQAVITGDGLAGRIVSIGDGSARVLLISDLNSRIPVLFEGSRRRAILAGDNSDTPRLVFLKHRGRITPGERILTSGHGGVFPPGIPVGVVSSAPDGVNRVLPFVRADLLEYVRVVDYRPVSSEPDIEAVSSVSAGTATPAAADQDKKAPAQ